MAAVVASSYFIRRLSFIHPAIVATFYSLPDVDGLLVAALSLAVIFVTDDLKRLENHRTLRLVLFLLLTMIGILGVASSAIQKQAEKQETEAERRKLTDQVSSLIAQQGKALQEAKDAYDEAVHAKDETISARVDLAAAKTDLAKQILRSQSVLSTNINQYRTDTTSAVARIIRPPRTLGSERADLIKMLKVGGLHDIAISPARGNVESLNFATEIEAAFRQAGWIIVRTKYPFITKDAVGLGIWVQPTLNLTPDQVVVAQAFKNIGMELNGIPNAATRTDAVELYVGLQ